MQYFKPVFNLICLKIAFFVIYAVLSINVMIAFIRGGSRYGDNGFQSIYRALHGHWDLPYVYRVLMPTLGRIILKAIPQQTQLELASHLQKWRDTPVIHNLLFHALLPKPFSDSLLFETSLMFFLVYLFLWGVIIMSYRLTVELMPDSPAYALIAPVIMLLSLTPSIEAYGFIYDFPEVFFCCSLLYLMHRQSWALYMICFELATLNKESTLLIIPVYFLWCWRRLPFLRYLMVGAAQIAIFLGVKSFLNRIYYNIMQGQTGYSQFSAIGKWLDITFYDYPLLICFIITIAFILYHWPDKPSLLKTGLWMLPPNIIFYIFHCNPGEYRDFLWNFPVLVLLITHTFVHWTGMPQWSIFRQSILQHDNACTS